MNSTEIKQEFSKIFLALSYIEGRFHLVKNFMKREVKQQLNHSLKSVVMTNKIFEKGLPDWSISDAENDVEVITNLIEICIHAELKERQLELIEDIEILTKKYINNAKS